MPRVALAVEGVQAQTRVLMRTLRRLQIPTLIFVNKIDRGGARPDGVLRDIAEKLTPAIVAMGSVDDAGTRAARVTAYGAGDAAFKGSARRAARPSMMMHFWPRTSAARREFRTDGCARSWRY